MKRVYYFLLLLIGTGFYLSCKKTDIATPLEPGNLDTVNFGQKEVEIIVPANSSFKPAGSKVFSFGTEETADASGKATITFEKGSSSVAYVFDANKKLVLAGFITDSTKIISPATTAKVLLYLGYHIPLQPDTLAVYFLNQVDKLTGAMDWQNEFEALFLSDPLALSNKNFVKPLKARIAKMTHDSAAIDIRAKVADIHIDENDIKSGLRITAEDLSNFSITNSYRRRAHAFLYKMSYKDMAGVNHDIKTKIETGTKAETDMAVGPVAAVTGFFGEIGKVIETKGLESFSLVSGPFPLELGDNELQALYKLRIVGPGGPGKLSLTEAESSTLTRLAMETFLFDLIIPTVGIITSLPDRPGKAGEMPDVSRDLKTDALMSFVKSMPDVYEEIKQGNYQGALLKLLENCYKDGTGVLMKELFMIALDRESVSGKVTTLFNEKFENLLGILSMTDAALSASDIFRITSHILGSTQLEEWEIKANSGQLKLLPDRSVVVPYQQQKLTANIQNLTQTASYEWSTSGKYGKLTDIHGHTDQQSFVSPDKDVFYTSKVSNTSLSDGDNLEYIYVTAFIGSNKVGTDTAIINVKKEKYEMKPSGITISGREGAQHEVRLYLEKTNGTNTIAPNSTTDYKVIWTTAGTYGKLNGQNVKSVTTLTMYDDNSAWYECLDKDTKTATETVKARIYSKAKSAPESEYKIFDEVTGSVKIDNDSKKRILHLPVTELHGDTSFLVGTQTGYNCAKIWATSFAEDKDAKSYQIMFYGAENFSGTQTYSWIAGNPSPAPPTSYAGSAYAGGVFTITWIGTGNYVNGWSPNHANGAPASGKAQVTIFLK